MKSQPPLLSRVRVKLALRGAVQGVGFRPFVHRLATELALTGWVNNSPQGVFVEAESPRPTLEHFLQRLESEKPPRSYIQSMEATWLEAVGFKKFEIRASASGGDITALVPPDIATCPDCLREISDPRNRRFRYPFTNCTNCGPRFSIIEALPYDRANTSMKIFAMCPACRQEYDNPPDRRFHAQPVACPACGPRVELVDNHGQRINENPYEGAANRLRAGQVVAIKGLGGFHLACDATNVQAVATLRNRKARDSKPFALMVRSVDEARKLVYLSESAAGLVTSATAPIMLCPRRDISAGEIAVQQSTADVSEYRHHGLEARAIKYSQPEALTGMMGTSRPSQAYLSSIFHR